MFCRDIPILVRSPNNGKGLGMHHCPHKEIKHGSTYLFDFVLGV